MSKLKIALQGNKRVEKEQFRIAKQQSTDYAGVLKLSGNDLEMMERQNIVVLIELTGVGSVKIFVKNICTPSNDGSPSFGPDTEGWRDLLQARVENVEQYSAGGGTSYFTTVPQDIHNKLLNALANEEYDLRPNTRIWP